MEKTVNEPSDRIIFLDNLRYLLVLCVVLQHSSNAYSGLFFLNWWPVVESRSSMIVAFLAAFFDAFTMPLLFYIAGYFALPTIQKHGVSSFIKRKLKRLGIPWVVCILTICPILPLIYHYTRDGLILSNSYLDLWIDLMKNAADFNVGIINSMDELMRNNGFYQRYMWFIALLISFFLVFSMIYKAKKRWFDTTYPITIEAPSVSSTLKLLTLVGLLSFICALVLVFLMTVVNNTRNPSAWFTLGNVVQFQLIRLAPYVIYFGMGVITYRNRWIERGKFPGHLKTWMISFIILITGYWFLMDAFTSSPIGSKAMYMYGFLSFPVYCFLTMSILGFFSSLAMRYWNRSTNLNRNFASNSYDIYLSHYLFVLGFQMILFTIPGIPILFKFAIVSASSMACAYLASQFIIKPFPKATVLGMFVILISMFIIIRP